MSTKQFKDFISSVFSPVSHLGRKFRRFLKRISRAVRRELLLIAKRSKRAGAGFVLPTVTMVMLVVVLLTLSIAFRSFERVNQARNVRVNQALLGATTPALDRAKAKIDDLINFNPATNVGGTPSEKILAETLADKTVYELPDEKTLRVAFDINANGTTDTDETISTAWQFPIDTDNNGKFDAYSIYGIFLRTPVPNSQGNFTRERKPLEARTPPMEATDLPSNAVCKALAASQLIGDSGWYYADGNLKKSFFVYATNIPITNATDLGNNFENSKGNSGTTAIEYQQDWTRQPLTNNAVVYEDDLGITPGPVLNLNGRIITNSNLFVSSSGANDNVQLFQISSPKSCFYKPENSKIIVGGNLIIGQFQVATNRFTTKVHLYNGQDVAPDQSKSLVPTTNQSVADASPSYAYAMYNDRAYADRINSLREVAKTKNVIPPEVALAKLTKGEDKAWDDYFKKRIRKVPYTEIGLDATGLPLGDATVPTLTTEDNSTGGKELIPPAAWILPTGNDLTSEPTKEAGTSNTKLIFQYNQLFTTDPDTAEKDKEKKETFFGDRILVGNNLPALRWFSTARKFLGSTVPQLTNGGTWNDQAPTTAPARYRTSQITPIPEVSDIGRDGFWERAAAETPTFPLANVGGLRIVTGAGIYDPDPTKTFLPQPLNSSGETTYDLPSTTSVEKLPIVWPDTMPMSTPSDPTKKGHLKMRATAVYHYGIKPATITKVNGKDEYDQLPIACVSSYYDPSTEATAISSNNGIVYKAPVKADRPESAVLPDSDGLLKGTPQTLYDQANYVYPDGRLVNPLLRDALQKNETARNIAERSAIDAEVCALGILGNDISLPTDGTTDNIYRLKPDLTTGVPDQAIKERSMLDARQVKAIDNNSGTVTGVSNNHFLNTGLTGRYDMPLEQRQPMEIRLTEINLDLLRNTEVTDKVDSTISSRIPSPEYLLPNSGLVYATRNDALPDRSGSPSVSPTDFLLDPTRRPNGISVIQGGYLARNDKEVIKIVDPADETKNEKIASDGQNNTPPADFSDIAKEKGLILVSDLPVYVKANSKGWFNAHSQNEFIDNTATFYAREKLNDYFACRPGDKRMPLNCKDGDTWRAATILSDAVTLLSNSFRYGYRNEGDFDLRNNAAGAYLEKADETISVTEARKQHGFFHNNFVTNGLSSGIIAASDDKPSDAPTDLAGFPVNDSDYIGSEPKNVLNSSYFNNFVTPVQRRGDVPEYVMEICRKLPVSACEPDDWVVGYDINNNGVFESNEIDLKTYDIDKLLPVGEERKRLGGGTTAFLPPIKDDWRYPRRVAFLKDRELSALFGKPIMKLGPLDSTVPTGGPSPIALGIKKISNVDQLQWFYYRRNSVDIPDNKPNSLWFWSTYDTTGHPYKTETRIKLSSIAKNKPLYWYPYDPAKSNDKKLPKVGTFTFQDATGKLTYCDNSNGSFTGYVVYQEPKDIASENPDEAQRNCGGLTDVRNFVNYATGLVADTTGWNGQDNLTIDAHPTNKLTTDTADDVKDTNNDKVIVVQIPNNIATNDPVSPATTKIVTININASKDQVVVFRQAIVNNNQKQNLVIGNQDPAPTGNLQNYTPPNNTVGKTSLQVKISGGIKPNNIFWALDKDLIIERGISLQQPHFIVGSIMGATSSKLIPMGNVTLMGRTLGFTGSNNLVFGNGGFPPPGTNIIGPTLIPEPQLVPVLQFYVPVSTPADNTAALAMPDGEQNKGTLSLWWPKAEESTFNLIVASNDIPARPYENNGALPNLARLLENWQFAESDNNSAVKLNISGSFVQLGRSKYATAPFNAVLNQSTLLTYKPAAVEIFDDPATTTVETLPYFDSSLFALPQKTRGYYTNTIANGRTPFFGPPQRIWGYDLGLLYQVPDLFAQKFSRPPANSKPDEYYREVGRDDAWVKGLLCAKVDASSPTEIIPRASLPNNFCQGYQ